MDGPKGYYTKQNKSDKGKYRIISLFVEYREPKQTNKQTKQKQTHKYRKQSDRCQRGGKDE